MKYRKILTLSLCIPLIGVMNAFADYAFDTKPTPIRTPPPEYPANLKRAYVAGLVVVELSLDDKGKVIDAQVVKSNQPKLESYAVSAVKRWAFKPALKDGAPISCRISVPIQFSLDD